jgi:transposase
MRLHANAPLGPKGRATMVRRVVAADWSLTQAAEAAGVSERTATKWVARYRREGEVGLVRPGGRCRRTPPPRVRCPCSRCHEWRAGSSLG